MFVLPVKLKLLIAAILLLVAGLVYFELREVDSLPPVAQVIAEQPDLPEETDKTEVAVVPELPKAKLLPNVPAGAIRDQRSLHFKDAQALQAFLDAAGDSVVVLDRIDSLNALRIQIKDPDGYLEALGEDDEEGYLYPINIPVVGDGSVQPGAVPLGNKLLAWLGVNEDNSNWGQGVKVAVLDSGVTDSFAFGSIYREILLVPYPDDSNAINGHGTAVASTIVGDHAMVPGVAPGVDLISVRISNDAGQSDSFLLAQGITQAVDAGAELINISMGGFGDSQIVRSAVEYAESKGALVIAAVGNNGVDQVFYPAAMDEVIGVGAVDAMGNHLNFSNTGSQVSVAAPGYEVNAAWTNNEVTRVSGTSFSAPIVTGTIAAVMTESSSTRLTPNQAWTLMQGYLNDGGSAGTDQSLGAGMPDMGRILNRDQAGYNDAAIAALSLLPPDSGNPYGRVEILVQNRGNESLVNTALTVQSPTGQTQANLTSLQPGGVQTVVVPVTKALVGTSSTFNIRTQVRVASGITDSKPQNNQRSVTYVPIGN